MRFENLFIVCQSLVLSVVKLWTAKKVAKKPLSLGDTDMARTKIHDLLDLGELQPYFWQIVYRFRDNKSQYN